MEEKKSEKRENVWEGKCLSDLKPGEVVPFTESSPGSSFDLTLTPSFSWWDAAETLLALGGFDNIVHYVKKPGSNNNIHQIHNAALTHNYTKLQSAGMSEILV